MLLKEKVVNVTRFFCGCAAFAAFASSLSAWAVTGEEILEHYDAIMSPVTFESVMQMTAQREDGTTRTYKMKSLKSGEEKFRMWFLGPAAVSGQEILRVGDNAWLYLPQLKRSSRIANRDSFQGGDFNNADVLRVNYKVDYKAVLLPSETADVHTVELTAKNQNTSYDTIILSVKKSDFMPVSGQYFGSSKKLLRSATFSDYKDFGKGYRRPGKVIMRNEVVKARFSELLFLEMKTGVDAPAQRFSLTDLGK